MMFSFKGTTRTVVLLGSVVLKLPKVHNPGSSYGKLYDFIEGMQANIREKKFSQHKGLCPLWVSIPFGLLNVMPKCRPMTKDEWDNFNPDLFCGNTEPGVYLPIEHKLDSFGRYKGRVVAVDYG